MNALLQRRARKPIGMTALIDVVFILLMFFMLTSSFVRRGAVDMTSQGASASAAVDTESRWVLLYPDGRIGAGPDAPRVMPDAAAAAGLIESGKPLLVAPLADTRLQVIVTALTTLRDLGPSRVSLGESVSLDNADATP